MINSMKYSIMAPAEWRHLYIYALTDAFHLRRKWLGPNIPIDDEDFEQQLEQVVVESTMPRGQQLNFCEEISNEWRLNTYFCLDYNSE